MGKEIGKRRHAKLHTSPDPVAETGLGFQFMVELITKALFLRGQMRLQDLMSFLKLSIALLEPLLAFMRAEHMCEVTRSGETETAISYILTQLGRQRAEDYLRKSQYVGPMPQNCIRWPCCCDKEKSKLFKDIDGFWKCLICKFTYGTNEN